MYSFLPLVACEPDFVYYIIALGCIVTMLPFILDSFVNPSYILQLKSSILYCCYSHSYPPYPYLKQ